MISHTLLSRIIESGCARIGKVRSEKGEKKAGSRRQKAESSERLVILGHPRESGDPCSVEQHGSPLSRG
jgi:hypothetical protein